MTLVWYLVLPLNLFMRSNYTLGCLAHWVTWTIIWVLCIWSALAGFGDAGWPPSALRDGGKWFLPLSPSFSQCWLQALWGGSSEHPPDEAQAKEPGVGLKSPQPVPRGLRKVCCIIGSLPEGWFGGMEDVFPAELFMLLFGGALETFQFDTLNKTKFLFWNSFCFETFLTCKNSNSHSSLFI